jgi:hypothetical protein
LWALAFLRIARHSSPFNAAPLQFFTPKIFPGCLFLRISEQFIFYSVRLLASRPTPNLADQGIPLCLAPTPWPVRLGSTTSSYATAGIALRVSGALKPHQLSSSGM